MSKSSSNDLDDIFHPNVNQGSKSIGLPPTIQAPVAPPQSNVTFNQPEQIRPSPPKTSK